MLRAVAVEGRPREANRSSRRPARGGRAGELKPSEQERCAVSLDINVRKNWIEVQKRHAHPVNAIGVKIDLKDHATLKVWKDEGIDAYVKK
jgi:hypothetical protein